MCPPPNFVTGRGGHMLVVSWFSWWQTISADVCLWWPSEGPQMHPLPNLNLFDFNRFHKITFLTIRFFFQFPHCANSKSRNYRRNTKNLHQNCILLSWTLSTKNRTSQKRSSNTLSNALCKNTTILVHSITNVLIKVGTLKVYTVRFNSYQNIFPQ